MSEPIPPPQQQDLQNRLHSHVKHLAGNIGERNIWHPQALQAAADYIRTQWAAQGYQVKSQTYEAGQVRSENLEVSRLGSAKPGQIILLGAHYDSVHGSPGANDNASGVAALLEIARHFSQRTPRCTLRFVAFVNEEPPFFYWDDMGSAIYARAAKARGDDIRMMISLEMLGSYSEALGSQAYPPLLRYFYPDRANFIALVSNRASKQAMQEFKQAFRQHSAFPLESLATFEWVPGVAWSDHLSFWRQGYAAFMVTDTAFYRYPYYHSPADTPEKLAYPQMTAVVVGIANALENLSCS